MELDIWVTDLRQNFTKKNVNFLKKIADSQFKSLEDRIKEIETTLAGGEVISQSNKQSDSSVDLDSEADLRNKKE